MKKTIKLAVVAALALGTTSVFATNGSALIGMGAKARGMAGLGIGMSHGAESALVNPALITSVKGTEVSFGGTVFMPHVKNTNSVNLGLLGNQSGSANSDNSLNLIPEVSLATNVNNHFYWGVGMWGTGGMGVDYRGNQGQMGMYTNLQLMQFGVPLAYKIDGLSIAVTPIVQYGSLTINYVESAALQNAFIYQATGTPGTLTSSKTVGNGSSQDYKWGYNVGLAYQTHGLTIGATYTSQIDMNYKGQLSTAMAGMGVTYPNNKLSTPATYGAGISYKYGGSTIGFDYKQIKWSSAYGYKDFDWKDQNVYTVGYQYDANTWAARIGYNYAKSPIKEQTSGLINTFNLLGFPAIVQSHVAVGGTYKFNKQTSLDVAYTYAFSTTDTYKNFLGQNISTTHSQDGVSAQLNYKF